MRTHEAWSNPCVLVQSTQPLTKPGDCKNLPRIKLITCLQIDRRVDIDVH